MHSSLGVQYSELRRLPYSKPIRMHMVDPMYCLFLGIAKCGFVTWINMNILDRNQLKLIDNKMVKPNCLLMQVAYQVIYRRTCKTIILYSPLPAVGNKFPPKMFMIFNGVIFNISYLIKTKDLVDCLSFHNLDYKQNLDIFWLGEGSHIVE